jgi:hypothetical protein
MQGARIEMSRTMQPVRKNVESHVARQALLVKLA